MTIFNLIKNISDLFYFFFSIIYFKIFNKNSKKSYYIFLKLYILYGHKINKIVNFLLKKKKNIIDNENSFLKNINTSKNLNYLEENGYLFLKDLVSKKDIFNFKNNLMNFKGYYSSANFKSTDKYLDFNNILATQFHYYQKDLVKTELVQKILSEKNILNLVQNYFNSFPIIYRINCWYNFKTLKPDASAAQLWHFDFESPKWLKLFIFLDDCNLENGPHEYVVKSHKLFPDEIRKRGYKRINDKELNSIISKDLKKKFIAKKGDILIEDTIGLHKGNFVKKNKRGVLQIVFSTSLFGGENNKIKFPKEKINELKIMIKDYPILFSNFND